MPHSLPPEDTTAEGVPITEPSNGNTQVTEETLKLDTAMQNGDSQISDTMDEDLTMADAGVEGETVPAVVAKEEKAEVKLEDLFADMESDEEFPSSNVRDTKVSSSPEAPLSPV